MMTTSPAEPCIVRDELDVRALAYALTNPQRGRVFVLISTPSNEHNQPHFNAAHIAAAVAEFADVYVIPAGALSFQFTDLVPDNLRVYGGAARVYPAPPLPMHAGRLVLAYDQEEGERRLPGLIQAAIEARDGVTRTHYSYSTQTASARTEAHHATESTVATTELEALRQSNETLRSRLEQMRREHAGEIRSEIQTSNDLRAKLAARGNGKTARKNVTPTEPPAAEVPWDAFLDPGEAVRFALYAAWVNRVPAQDKAEFPLPAFGIGHDFAESLRSHDPAVQQKALRCAVDVLTGRLGTRGIHPLRTGRGGNDLPVMRDDGAVCMRAYVEKNTASARRLHFWKLPDGSLELSRVNVHDDVTP
ncbi:hypothetical protein ACFVAJ_19315 [Agromyces sp. NPDC057679]|uniref:hypothetical protein n=1 Tax=Agromyces sp. NPDC057679 TaxID=3346207 RepID=UPI003670A5DC